MDNDNDNDAQDPDETENCDDEESNDEPPPAYDWEIAPDTTDEAEFDDMGIDTGSPERNWISEQGGIDTQPLDDILDEYYSKEDISKTGIKIMPVGLKTFFYRVKQRKKCSLQTVQYHASRHGCLIVIKNETTKELMRLYDRKLIRAEEATDVALLRRLEERNEKVNYTYPEKYQTSIVVAKDMTGLLSNMADAIGVSNIKLYCWLCIVSALTLTKPVAGIKVLADEAEHFWEIVDERIVWLRPKTPEH